MYAVFVFCFTILNSKGVTSRWYISMLSEPNFFIASSSLRPTNEYSVGLNTVVGIKS